MKVAWQASRGLILLTTLAVAANAQTSAGTTLPEIATFVQQAILQQRFAKTKERDYVFREDFNSNKLGNECTWGSACQPPFGGRSVSPWTNYQVLKYTTRHFEVFWPDGVLVARILPDDNSNQYGTTGRGEWTRDIPTSETELAVENQRVDSEIAEARALRARGKEIASPDDPPQILLSKMLELRTFSNPRRQVPRFCLILHGTLLKRLQAQEKLFSSISRERSGLTSRTTALSTWKVNLLPT
jgi:hypothetical protein